LYQQHCASCHGAAGEGGRAVELVGDRALLNTDYPDKGVGVVWPYAPTLYAYIERSMPPDNTQAFTADEYYALVAYVLHLNALLPEGAMLDKEALAGIKMPNVSNWRP